MSNCINVSCPICGTNNIDSYRDGINSITDYECKTCGRFRISDLLNATDSMLQCAMFYYQILNKKSNDKFISYRSERIEVNEKTSINVTKKELSNLFPKTLSRRFDLILLNLNAFTKNVGNSFHIPDDITDNISFFAKMLFVAEEDEGLKKECVDSVFKIMEKQGYIRGWDSGFIEIDYLGWLRIEQLQKNSDEIPQGFIAMWFNDSMQNARNAIIEAIEDCGYTAMIIDIKEHNNQIVPEILYEIKKSSFIVADLTGHRGGVYYEAGYANALGKEVILTCKDNDLDKLHFDVKQQNTIFWNDTVDLKERIKRRIMATIGKI